MSNKFKSKKMKILVITPYYKPAFKYGGPVNSISRICEALTSTPELALEVFTTNANADSKLNEETRKSIVVDGVNVTYFNKYFNNNFFISPSFLVSLVKRVKEFDIVHVNMWWNWLSIFGAIVAITAGKKLIISPRSNVTQYILHHKNRKFKELIHNSFGKKLLSKAHFHITAQLELDDVKKLTPVKSYSIIHNLINLPQIQFSKTRNEIFTIIFLSRIDRKKGLELLLESLSQVTFDYQLKIGGDGDPLYVSELKELCEILGISSKIIWLGWLNNQEKFIELSSSDLFALTSYNENFANVVIEALYVSTPVMISNEVGLHEFVKDNELGWITKCSVESITTTLNFIFQNREGLQIISDRARPVIMESFPEHKLVAHYLDMYKQVLNN